MLTGFWSTETMQARIPQEDLITPYDPKLIANCSYELRLGAEVYVTGEQSKTKREIKSGEQVRIPPGQFANLLTEETVRIPADALGLISAKFRWKQRGPVNVSGFHVDPGYTGKILFSVFNAGPEPVVVARGDALFLLWYCSLDSTTADTYDRPPRTVITSGDVGHLQGVVATPQALATRVEALERIVSGAKWTALAVVGAVLAALIGIAVNGAVTDDGGNDVTTTTPAAPSPSSAPTTQPATTTTTSGP